MSSQRPGRRSPCRRRPTIAPPPASTPSGPGPRPPKCSACAPRASCPCPSSRSRSEFLRRPAPRGLFLRGYVERHGQRLHVTDLDQISDLDEIEVLRVLRLDGLG